MFQSNMVIQRDKPIMLRGWADPGEKVNVFFAGQKQTATASKSRKWKVTLPAMPANENGQVMKIAGKSNTLNLENILLGDVWVVGGQSNMQQPLSSVENGGLEVASANFPNLRILTVPALIDNKTKNEFPGLFRHESGRHHREGDWDVCSPKTVPNFSAIGYVFARRLHMAANVPIGVIDISRFGTTIEAWTPLEIIKQDKSKSVQALLADWEKQVSKWDGKKDLERRVNGYNARVKGLKAQGKKIPANLTLPTDLKPGPEMNQNYPGNCYASILSPIAGFPVKGAIFHQGFNNARPDADTFYYQLFPKMIESWRAAIGDPNMPFGIISLCTDGVPQSLDNYVEKMDNAGIYIREAQYKTFLDYHKAGDKNVGYASSYDLRRNWYHPMLKIPAGERIARWALNTQYGMNRNIHWKPAMVTKMEAGNGQITLHFDSEVDSITEGAIEGFAIAGKDKQFQPATAELLVTGKDSRNRLTLNRKVIVLTSPHVTEPVHFRYAWGRNPMGNLQHRSTSHRDIPFATQRSDSWAPVSRETGVEVHHRSRSEKLKQIDQQRLLKDAQILIEANKK
jgi:sialate O-acetylesterase